MLLDTPEDQLRWYCGLVIHVTKKNLHLHTVKSTLAYISFAHAGQSTTCWQWFLQIAALLKVFIRNISHYFKVSSSTVSWNFVRPQPFCLSVMASLSSTCSMLHFSPVSYGNIHKNHIECVWNLQDIFYGFIQIQL